MYIIKPKIPGIKNKTDLLNHLKSQTTGIIAEDFYDSYNGAVDDIKSLQDENEIICFPGHTLAKSVLFKLPEICKKDITNDEIKKLWNDVDIPKKSQEETCF